MSTLSMYEDTSRATIGTPVIFLPYEAAASSPASSRRTTGIARQSMRAAGRAIVRWHRAGQLGGDETLRAARWTGARC